MYWSMVSISQNNIVRYLSLDQDYSCEYRRIYGDEYIEEMAQSGRSRRFLED